MNRRTRERTRRTPVLLEDLLDYYRSFGYGCPMQIDDIAILRIRSVTSQSASVAATK